MKAYEILCDEVTYGFRKLHGRCGVYIYRPISPIGCIIKILKLFLQYNPYRSICIVTENTQNADELRKACNYHLNHKIDILTKVYRTLATTGFYDLIITVNIYDLSYIKSVIEANTVGNKNSFYLCIFDRNDIKDKNYNKRNSLLKFIPISVQPSQIIEETIYSPVKETLIKVSLNAESRAKYNDCNDFITKAMRIFGSFETLDRARVGCKHMNQSYIDVCNTIAFNNGWDYELDTSTDIGREIDDTFNPNVLHEKALLAYNIMKNRKDIVTDAEEKLSHIAKIVFDNKDKKILIVSARGEYANKITEYLNQCSSVPECEVDIEICANYHNDIPDKVQLNKDGTPVLIKSGLHKGEPKVIGTQKQSTLAEKDFNDDVINALSIKATSDSKLSVDCDIVILTSPLIGSIYDIRRRFQNVYFRTSPFEVYTLYCDNTTEHTKINKFEGAANHTFIKNDDEIFIDD